MDGEGRTEFVRISTMLRAPRVAVLISPDAWELQARFAIEALSRVWGGLGGVIVPVGPGGEVHPQVFRVLRDYDPDYLAPLVVNARQYEDLCPGRLLLRDSRGRRILAPHRRKKWLDLFGDGWPIGPTVQESAVESLSRRLGTFKEDGERVFGIHSNVKPANPLSAAPEPESGVSSYSGTTGHDLLDLAVLARTGFRSDAVDQEDLGATDGIAIWDAVLGTDRSPTRPSAFTASGAHLVGVGGWRRRHSHLIVLGDSADDFALAMLLDRTHGDVAWLPRLVNCTKAQRGGAGDALTILGMSGHEPIPVTSLSVSPSEVGTRLLGLWNARTVRLLIPSALQWTFTRPDDLDEQAARTYAVQGAWDRRRTIPVVENVDGSSEMLSPPALEWLTDLEQLDLRWVVEHDRLDRSLPLAPTLHQSLLVAKGQNPDETFIRVSRGAIAYERGRWDFVAAGASVDGRAASPLLRWPSLNQILQAAAQRTGKSVRLSDAGRRAQIVAGLWGSQGSLVTDLIGASRTLLNAFIPPTKDNGPYPVGQKKGIARYGRGHLSFDALLEICTPWDADQLRTWLDDKSERRILRRGLLLGCEACGSVDFFAINDVGQNNECPRCGNRNPLRQDRWREPHSEPQWFYDLHPAVASLITQNGDLPLIAWHHYQQAPKAPSRSWFEFELVGADNKPIVEFDIVGLHGSRLVLGEAKIGDALDGKTAKAKERDARKLLQGAVDLGADEVCLASATRWSAASRDAAKRVQAELGVRITLLEDLASDPTAKPTRLT